MTELINQLWQFFKPLFYEVVKEAVSEVVSRAEQKEVRYYSRNELAQMLGVSLPTITRMVKQGRITPRRLGKRVLFNSKEIEAALKENKLSKYKHLKTREI